MFSKKINPFSIQTRKLISVCLFSLSVATPILLWLFAGPPVQITSLSSFLGAIGQVFAIVGVVLFALQFVLAARYNFVEFLLSGLNRVYVLHHLLGGFAFVFILFHPISFFLQNSLFSLQFALKFLFPPLTQIGIWLGIIAVTLLILLLLITYSFKLRYEIWKFTHQFLGISFIIAFAHTLLVPSTLAINNPLKLYLVGVYSIGIFSFLYYKFLKPFLVKKYSFRVVKIKQHPDSIHEIKLSPDTEIISYQPGQFAFVTFKSPAVSAQSHPFSYTSSPSNSKVSFAIKAVGDFTSSINLLRVGDMAHIEGPYGNFTQENIHNRNQIWIAGGIGITPFLSFIRSFPNPSLKKVHLFYSVSRTPAAFASELKFAAGKYRWFNYTVHNTSVNGRLTLNSVIQNIPSPTLFDILLCGPIPMMKALKKQAIEQGYPQSQLHSEEFRLYT